MRSSKADRDKFDPKKIYIGGCPRSSEEELTALFQWRRRAETSTPRAVATSAPRIVSETSEDPRIVRVSPAT